MRDLYCNRINFLHNFYPSLFQSILMTTFKEDLEKHIANSGIDVEGLRKSAWRDMYRVYEHDLNILKHLDEDRAAKFNSFTFNLSREDKFRENIRRGARLKEMAYEGKIPHVDHENTVIFVMAMNSFHPTSVHHSMFESIIRVVGSDEQVAEILDDVLAYKIIGCYAQTEIGHGSDVQGLQTEAIYDEATEEFIINSPSIKAYKFWPGDLGKMANYACVFAKLLVKGQNYGVQSFLVRIRDSESHTPLKGIEIGDIGPKYGYACKDNGYMAFNNIRVPRSSILSRYINVSKKGDIEVKGDPRIGYATMLGIRVGLIMMGWQVKFSSLAHSVRYRGIK